MIHEPELLILDEPTIGLDPNQIRQVRDLIRNLKRHHTILISSHILPEVEMTCNRVIIINRGRIEASDTPDNLRSRLGIERDVVLEAKVADAAAAAARLRALEEVEDVGQQPLGDWTQFTIRTKKDAREKIYRLTIEEKWAVRELSRREVSLEQVFTEITHRDEP